jgi:hypothetical protein
LGDALTALVELRQDTPPMIRFLTWLFAKLEHFTGLLVKWVVWLPAKIQGRRHRRPGR